MRAPGAVGIEALSRGAARVVFVDSSVKSTRLISENLEALGYRDHAAVVTKDVLQFLKKTASELGPFDIVFVDPPYHEKVGMDTMELLGAEDAVYLSADAIIVFEHFKKYHAPEEIGRLDKKKDYNYGDTVVSVYRLLEKE